MATKGKTQREEARDDADFMIDDVLKSLVKGEITPASERGVLNYTFRIFLNTEADEERVEANAYFAHKRKVS